jgi:hypothetical protein
MTPPLRRWMFGVRPFAFSSNHEQEHPPLRNVTARQASMGISTMMITARINQPSTTNHQSSFQSGLAISLQVDC